MQLKQHNWKNNWEPILFKVVLVLISIFLIFKLYQINYKGKENNISTHSEPNQNSILAENAFEYLNPINNRIKGKSPFKFQKSMTDPRRIRRRPTHRTTSHRIKQHTQKVIPKIYVYLTYAGWIKNGDARVFAIIIHETIKSKKITRFTGLSSGDSFKGLTITTIKKDNLLIKNNLGMTIRIPIHKRLKVRIK